MQGGTFCLFEGRSLLRNVRWAEKISSDLVKPSRPNLGRLEPPQWLGRISMVLVTPTFTLALTLTLTLTFTLALTRHPQRLRFLRPIHRHGRGGAARRAHFLGRRHHGHPGRQGELL